ncbi:tRNA pseudouridine synthase Pus10 [Asbolus verrucosus]|uniref:tRNA pseudouridine(55) synthase n=1 Tax=Asbolus verrucosus TaxID=1661398 RepID=A0A482VQM9_ASBVE|nr:tRNA pseudouridine synthase Pus10 [Asbolus verrucosus]
MASEEEVNLYNDVINKGCCKRCALRYLGCCKSLITFDHPDTCLTNFGYITTELTVEPKSKKLKNNPCIVCLGLLQDSTLEQMLTHENLMKVEEYESQTFVAYITFPTCILVRDHNSKVIKVNHAWRYSVEEKLCKLLNKTYDHHSKLTLHFYTSYMLEDDMLQEMAIVENFVRNHGTNILSKHYVTAFLEEVPDETFINLVKVPPRIPLYEVTLKELKYFSEAIHLIGNYCKYSRQLLQVPSARNREVEEFSIETIILNAFKNSTGSCYREFKEMLFKASSFDERSVRVLGGGRTFHLQIINPKFKSITQRQCRKIEKKIKKTKIMSVQKLRQATKRDIHSIMDSEQLSPRSFKVLCVVYMCKNIDYCVNAVNMHTCVTVLQKTPLRLLQDRDIKKKKKKIFYIRATKVKHKDNFIELDLCTESGFHVPEFVHGDLGRTNPSLGDIMRAKVDVLAIDVVDFFATVPCPTEEEDVII